MKKVILLFLSIVLFSSTVLRADLKTDLDKSMLESLGKAVADVTGLSDPATLITAFKDGNFKLAFTTLANMVTDKALDLIPLYGPAKFASDLVKSFGNVLMTYINNSIIESMWQRFMDLSDYEKQDWLNGNDDDYPEMTYYYGSLSVKPDELRKIFRTAWEEYKTQTEKSKLYMDYTAKITKIIKLAKEKLPPSLYYPADGSKIKITSKIQIWRSKNNYFKLVLTLPDGATFTKFIKDPSDPDQNHTTTFRLSDFEGVDWNKYFQQYPDGVDVTIDVTAGVYDSTGLMKSLMPDLVTPKESLVKVANFDGEIFVKSQFHFKVISNIISCSGTISGTMYMDYSSDYMSGTQSEGLDPSTIKYQCDPSTSQAQLIIDNGNALNGKCDENGEGSFGAPLGLGSIYLYIKVSCNPLKLSFYSTGSYVYNMQATTADGEVITVPITISNIRGSLK